MNEQGKAMMLSSSLGVEFFPHGGCVLVDYAVKAGADAETMLRFAYEEEGVHHLRLWWAPVVDEGRLRLPALPVQGERAKVWTRTNGENAWREVKKGVWKLE